MTEPFYFPHEQIRSEQQKLAQTIHDALLNKEHVIAHAPTGLGKTAASLAPTVSFAIQHKKKVLFLTSRFTQHTLALETLRMMKNKHDISFQVSDMVAKKTMCLMNGVQNLASNEFSVFCKKARENAHCLYYINTRKQNQILTQDATVLKDSLSRSILSVETIKSECEQAKMCPYEMAIEISKNATVIIGDYYYVFSPRIREAFFKKAEISLADTIIVVDEAHNLPDRIKEMASSKLTSFVLNLAAQEAEKNQEFDLGQILREIQSILEQWNKVTIEQKIISKQWLIDVVEQHTPMSSLLDSLKSAADKVLINQQRSYLSSVHDFFVSWQGEDAGFIRIISKEQREGIISISYRCLDPGAVMQLVLENCHSVVCMSGTLKPLDFYADILGLTQAQKISFKNPFPAQNALHVVVPKTSTKFSTRSPQQFLQIAHQLIDIINVIPGNCIIFFPSYTILKEIFYHCEKKIYKTLLREEAQLRKEERTQLLESFKKLKDKGAVLFAVATGSFGEGIDLPGDLLHGVIVVGVPLQKPSVETQALIDYYQQKFGQGWNYGYLYPAFNKTLQNAGRCIRSNTDKGVIVYLDERFAQPQYLACFPDDVQLIVDGQTYLEKISRFFLSQNIITK